ncbi:MAG: 2,3-bisphosphoglycerate-independent phosphoglycerate mutase [Desulfobacteraceae bacterium]|nr:2,3-bisphosphoglycerate-independent phosphoglycerate mutase [Desulfobacteraceae bacterium]
MGKPKPIMLMILDGWGLRSADANNAVTSANTPVLDSLWEKYPHTLLQTSGKAVGLPEAVMGNSEVGHMNIGAGRIVYQDLLRIDMAISQGDFFENSALNQAMDAVLENGRNLHLMGLVSDGGVHSHITHICALLDLAKRKGLKRVFVHAIMDGRDTAPDSGRGYIKHLQQYMDQIGTGVIASICGRYYAMDRDTRWDRTKTAFKLYTEGSGLQARDAVQAIEQAYDRGETDEFIKPIVLIDDHTAQPRACVSDKDAVVFFNFRADRARQITRAFTDKNFDVFQRDKVPQLSDYVCMALYDEHFDLAVAFPPEHLDGILGEVLSRHGVSQLRIAETEKYAHVTYFFNGGEEKPFELEDRCLIPSPRDVETYDHKPEMSAGKVTQEVLKRIDTGKYDFIVLNFANMDMVGHTGVMQAAQKAVETVDGYVGRIKDAVISKGGIVLITSDHGNAETMRGANGKVYTAHTTNPVPFIIAGDTVQNVRLKKGVLGDIAPTVLKLLGIEQPPQMTGRSLIGQ